MLDVNLNRGFVLLILCLVFLSTLLIHADVPAGNLILVCHPLEAKEVLLQDLSEIRVHYDPHHPADISVSADYVNLGTFSISVDSKTFLAKKFSVPPPPRLNGYSYLSLSKIG